MVKILYCFTLQELKKRWKSSQEELRFDEYIENSINRIHLSILSIKGHGFKVEFMTDIESSAYIENFPIDSLSRDLEFFNDQTSSWTELKMFACLRQNSPFVLIEWDLILDSSEIIKKLKVFDKDFIVASEYKIPYHYIKDDNVRISHQELGIFAKLLDHSNHFIDEFQFKHLKAFNCKILGFNNIKFKNNFISNFLICRNVARENSVDLDCTLVAEEYLLYCLFKANDVTYDSLFLEKGVINSNENKNEQLSFITRIKDNLFRLVSKRDKMSDFFLQANTKKPDVIKYKINQLNHKEVILKLQNKFLYKQFSQSNNINFRNRVKLSLCTVAMNRKDHAIRTLKANVSVVRKFNESVDINLLNYNSTDGLEEYLFKQKWFVRALEDGILNYYRNYEALFFHRAITKNLIHYMSKGEYLVNVDADNYVSKQFLNFCLKAIQQQNIFMRPSIDSSQGTMGRIVVNRNDFVRIKGYDTRLENYGFDDTELTMRLKKHGIKQKTIPSHIMDAIEHSDELRIKDERNTSLFNNYPLESDFNNRKLIANSPVQNFCYKSISIFKINFKNQKEKVDLGIELKNLFAAKTI